MFCGQRFRRSRDAPGVHAKELGSMHKDRFVIVPLAIVALVLVARTPSTAELKPGDTLGSSNADQAEGLLPPEMLEHYKKGEYQNPIADWPVSKYNWPPDFKAATETNEGKYKVGPGGEIL